VPEGAALVGAVGGRAVYVGYSMGGRLCLDLALAQPELVRGLVLVSTTAGIDDPDERAARRQADDATARELERDGVERFIDRWLATPLMATLAASAQNRAERLTNTVDGLASSLRLAGTGTTPPRWGELATLTAPTLIVVGSLDVKFAALGQRLAAGIGPSATLAIVDGAGHAVHLERPEEFLTVVCHWLEHTIT